MQSQIILSNTHFLSSCLHADTDRWSIVRRRQRALQGETAITVSLLPAERGADNMSESGRPPLFVVLVCLFCWDLDGTWEPSGIWSFINATVFACECMCTCAVLYLLRLQFGGNNWRVNPGERKRSDWESWRACRQRKMNERWGKVSSLCPGADWSELQALGWADNVDWWLWKPVIRLQ